MTLALAAPPIACTYKVNDWPACQPDGTQTRTVASSPTGCTGTPPPATQSCIYVPPLQTTEVYIGTETTTVTYQPIAPAPGCTWEPPQVTQTVTPIQWEMDVPGHLLTPGTYSVTTVTGPGTVTTQGPALRCMENTTPPPPPDLRPFDRLVTHGTIGSDGATLDLSKLGAGPPIGFSTCSFNQSGAISQDVVHDIVTVTITLNVSCVEAAFTAVSNITMTRRQ